jgi:F-type H+-transporting ATPase subunit b
MQLISTFGIDWKLLVAQLINFFVLFFVLKRYAYGPIVKMLDERKDKIEKGIKDSEAATKKLSEMEQKEKETLDAAREEAQKIMKIAEETGKSIQASIVTTAHQEADKMIADAKKKIEGEKEKLMHEVKAEISGLVVMATEKILNEKIDSNKDKELIEKAIK